MSWATIQADPHLHSLGAEMMKKNARQAFVSLEGVNHHELVVKDVGLVVNPQCPHLRTSPLGAVLLCCPPSLFEIKSLSKYATVAISAAVGNKDICLDANLELKKATDKGTGTKWCCAT